MLLISGEQGISTSSFKTMEGNESTVTVNVISTFLLALLILPKLQESAQRFNITPTLCIVSSEVHFFTSVFVPPYLDLA